MVEKEKVAELKLFISYLEKNPKALFQPELRFFREYMEKHGSKFPSAEPDESKHNHDEHQQQQQQTTNGMPAAAATESKCKSGKPAASAASAATRQKQQQQPEKFDAPAISDDEPDSDGEGDDDAAAVGGSGGDVAEDPMRMLPEADDFPSLCSNGEDLELSEETLEKISVVKQKIADLIDAGSLKEALEQMMDLFKMSVPTALLYCKRADLLLKLKRPCAAIRDCDEALRLNPDSGKAYRIRGVAHRCLHNWEDSYKDITTAQKIDFDESVEDIEKLSGEKWRAIEAKRRASQRRREERAARNKLRQRRRAQVAARKAYYCEPEAAGAADDDLDEDFDCCDDEMPNFGGTGGGGMPPNFADMFKNAGAGGMPNFGAGAGGMPNFGTGKPGGMPPNFGAARAGGMPNFGGGSGAGGAGGGGLGGFGNLLGGLMQNPELKKLIENPRVLQAVMEMSKNPASMSKYQNDPDVMAAVKALSQSMFAAGGPGATGAP